MRTNNVPAIKATPNATATVGTDGGEWENSWIAATRAERKTMTWTEETLSHSLDKSGSVRGVTSSPLMNAAITTGTLIRNTEPHQKCLSSSPPIMGPKALPTMDRQLHRAIARLRSRSSSKVIRMSARVAGIIVAAPIARIARAPINAPGVGANAAAREASPNNARPPRNI